MKNVFKKSCERLGKNLKFYENKNMHYTCM